MAVMKSLLEAKMSQVPAFKGALIESDGYFLAETTSDCFWTNSLPSIITEKTNPQTWPGMNKLGNIMINLCRRILSKRHNKQNLSDEETAEIADDETDSEYFNPPGGQYFLRRTTQTFDQCFGHKWPNTS